MATSQFRTQKQWILVQNVIHWLHQWQYIKPEEKITCMMVRRLFSAIKIALYKSGYKINSRTTFTVKYIILLMSTDFFFLKTIALFREGLERHIWWPQKFFKYVVDAGTAAGAGGGAVPVHVAMCCTNLEVAWTMVGSFARSRRLRSSGAESGIGAPWRNSTSSVSAGPMVV